MSYVRVPNRAAVPRPRVAPVRPIVPRNLPVLQPPPFYRQQQQQQSDFLYEEPQEQYVVETQDQLSTFQNVNKTQPITVHYPTFNPKQNYPNKPGTNRSTQPVRSAQPKYPTTLPSIQ